MTNTSSPTDSYPYYLAVGVALPAGARPTCNKCLKDAMAIFATAAGNASQPLSRIYVGAANQINIGCGTDFVDSSVVRTSAAAASRTASPTRHLAFLTTLAALLLLLLRP